jgi:hypothetical protein
MMPMLLDGIYINMDNLQYTCRGLVPRADGYGP